MRFSGLLAAFCLTFSFLLAKPCVSDQVNHLVDGSKLNLPLLSRKIKFNEEANVKNTYFMAKKKVTVASSGNKPHEKEDNVMYKKAEAGKGTWREWVEAPNKSEFFTMDYAWVRRRLPIHNKQFPNFVP